MAKTITPYANETESLKLADLTIENRTDRVSIFGSIDLTRDKAGLQDARMLKVLLDQVVQALEADKRLPERLPPPERPEEVKNPFQ
jgi:hypothetical protein